MNTYRSEEDSIFTARLLNSIWSACLTFLAIALTITVLSDLSDYQISGVERSQLLTISTIFVSWCFFKPVENVEDINVVRSNYNAHELCQRSDLFSNHNEFYSCITQSRMVELKNYHMISQEYVFPFPYLCQIYHLLNLKHLEEVHSFSLSNLKIIKVSNFQPTKAGGAMKFQTVLDSPLNTLRIWRQPLVEVDLILHTPYTVELNIPAYNDKRIVVIFNVLPLNDTEHKLFIDIYSNLSWPKPILQILLHLASCLTVFEDLPYLRKLAEKNLDRIVRLSKVPSHDTMQLFKRFAELYGSGA